MDNMAASVDQKLLRQTKFPPEFNQKIDMEKVNIEVMKKWIAGKISEILDNEDDVVIELCFNLLEGSRFPNIKVLQIQLTGFLDKDTASFCKELWNLCISAQSNAQGVPKELLEAKKLELIQEKAEAEKAAFEARKRQEHERARDRDMQDIRRQERGERPAKRMRNQRLSREWKDRRNSRSPPRRFRDSRDSHQWPMRREADSYVPGERYRGPRRRARSRSPPRRAKSHSRSRSSSPVQAPRRKLPSKGREFSSERSMSPPYRPGRGRPNDRDVSSSRSRSRGSGARRRRSFHRGDHHARSFTPSGDSRSRSPRRKYRRRDRSSPRSSVSRSPPRYMNHDRGRNGWSRGRSSSSDHSRSSRMSGGKEVYRNGRLHPSRDGHIGKTRADNYKGRDSERYHQHYHSPSRRSRSMSRSPHPRRKRRPSVERYDPRAKRRCDEPPKDQSALNSSPKGSALDSGTIKSDAPDNDMDPQGEAEAKSARSNSTSLLREKLLKEKLIARRRSSGAAEQMPK